MRWRRFAVSLILLALVLAPESAAEKEQAPAILVFVAASLSDSVQEIGAAFTEQTGIPVRVSSGGSLALAQQILRGAPADLFIPASPFALIPLERKHLIDKAAVFEWLVNSLVAVAPADRALPLGSSEGLAAEGFARVAIGDPDVVPAGMYARQALVSLKLWDRLQGRLVLAGNVRAALAYVESGEADLGIVYASDARVTPRVQIVYEFPLHSHSPIRYPIAVVARTARAPGTRPFVGFLRSPEALRIVKAAGFTPAKP